jgi:cytochrome c peroxidase
MFRVNLFAAFVVLCLCLLAVPEGRGKSPFLRLVAEGEEDPPEVAAGERLFRETRFAQFFFAHQEGPNIPLKEGDPSLKLMPMAGGKPLLNPYGKSMNCATCHLVDEALDQEGMRAYSDFAFKSFVPARAEDREAETPRNSPSLVGVMQSGKFLHFDGEFSRAEDLVIAGWTGRNNGWLPSEHGQALAHIARILREDDGSFAEDGIAYRDLFSARGGLPAEYQVSFSAPDGEIIEAAARLVKAYMASLEFTRITPFDIFLEQNGLPKEPGEGESAGAYHARLLQLLNGRSSWKFVEVPFKFHKDPGKFGAEELAGAKLFLDRNRGNCASCHSLPNFTDGKFHNTGVSQIEFDNAHGPGAFARLAIPSLATRSPERDLPAVPGRPAAPGPFRAAADPRDPRKTDLGLWNVFANPAYPRPQAKLAELLCAEAAGKCDTAQLLDRSVARFKTPSLRDLGHSGPFLHNGQAISLERVMLTYLAASALAKNQLLRNGAPEIREMTLQPSAVKPLAAFLRSLNEDYE